MTTFFSTMTSPVGELTLRSDGKGLIGLAMEQQRYGPESAEEWVPKEDAVLTETRKQLAEYFAGKRTHFDLPLNPSGTAFQKQVWMELVEIPYGKTISYGELAKRIGKPAASRAVGLANGHNPISIIVPCHRVIGANGSLTGYGGGLDRKRALLAHESRVLGFELVAL